jgi:hypothetical protein
LFLPDIDPPWLAKLLWMWVWLGPFVVLFAVRRGQTIKAVVVYLVGSCVAVIGGDLLTFGWPTNRALAQGYGTWCWSMAYPIMVVGGALLVVALGAGYVSRWLWRPRTRVRSATTI